MSKHPTLSDQDLQVMYDKIALSDLVQLYCRAVDRRDMKLLASLYHPDSTDDHTPFFKGSGPDFIKAVPSITERFATTSHVIVGSIFHVDGDYAEGESHVEAYHLSAQEPLRETIAHGRYLDRYERRDGVWKFLARTTVFDWSEARPYDRELMAKISRGTIAGQPSEKDPVYSLFKLVKWGDRRA